MEQCIQISVIIPVYNVENYIAKCIDSVLQQADENIEIICVNDESPDGSRDIIEDYMSKHSNIKCIDRPNGGLSAARNTGIDAANGEYIVLLDSDDWLENNILDKLYKQAKENNLDVLVANTKWIYPNKTHIEKQNYSEIVPSVITGSEAIVKLMQAEVYVPMAYNYIYKRESLNANNLSFKEGLIYEDELWTPQVLLKAKRVMATSIYHYNYLQRSNTITNSKYTQFNADCFLYVSKNLLILSNNNENKQLQLSLISRACILFFRASVIQKDLNGLKLKRIISAFKIMQLRVNSDFFNHCITNLNYTKNQRRLLRLTYKLFC